MSSSSSHVTVTYTSISSALESPPWGFPLITESDHEAPKEAPQSPKQEPPTYVPAPEYLEYLAPSDDEPIEDDFKEDPKMDLVDYADDEEEEEEEEPSEDDDEEEKHLAPADSTLPVSDFIPSSEETEPFETDESAATPPPPCNVTSISQTGLHRARKTIRPQRPMAASIEARIAEYASAPTPPSPPPSPLSPLSFPLLLIPSSPLLLTSPTCIDIIPKADMPLQKRVKFTTPSHRFEIKESSESAAARHPEISLSRGTKIITALEEVKEDMTDLFPDRDWIVRSFTCVIMTCRMRELCYRLRFPHLGERGDIIAKRLSLQRVRLAKVRTLHAEVRVLQRQRIDDGDRLTSHIQHQHDRFRVLESTRDSERQDGPADPASMALGSKMAPKKTPMTNDAIKQLIAQGVADALAKYEANRSSENGYDSHDSGSGRRRTEHTTHECAQSDFLKCQPLNFKGSEGVKYVGGLPDMIQGSVMASKPKTMQEAIEIANDLVDQKVRTFTERQAENKRKLDDNTRNNLTQQQPHKSKNVARAYTVGPGEKKDYRGSLPLCTKCNYHHNGQCAPKCKNCKKVGHRARDCRSSAATANNQRALGEIQRVVTCFECGVQGHYKKDYPKLKNKNCENQARNGEARARAYAVGNAWTNSDSNFVTGTLLLNNRYASILFDTSADRSFVSTAFSSLINIFPTTLDHDYDVELADRKIIGVNTIIWGCTLNFLNHPFNIDLMPVELGSFDAIIGMNWLAKYHAVIICDEKIIDEVFLALRWHLEEMHVTLAHLEKKQTRLRLYTKNHEELCIQSVETASPL
ncbi:putative reverse transcriptase domain-containing protein [Tanacetum coccineum]